LWLVESGILSIYELAKEIYMRQILPLWLLPVAAIGYGQEPKKPSTTESQETSRENDYKVIQELFHKTYPPLHEHIQVTIESSTPLQLLHDPKTNKDVGSMMMFEVGVKNIGTDAFDFVPDNIAIAVLDSDGLELPKNKVKRIESGHGGSGTYPIEKSKSDSKPIVLGIEDPTAKLGAKYTIIASYVKLWEKPSVHYDSSFAAKVVNIVPLVKDGPVEKMLKK
jgi:hypothetical protein